MVHVRRYVWCIVSTQELWLSLLLEIIWDFSCVSQRPRAAGLHRVVNNYHVVRPLEELVSGTWLGKAIIQASLSTSLPVGNKESRVWNSFLSPCLGAPGCAVHEGNQMPAHGAEADSPISQLESGDSGQSILEWEKSSTACWVGYHGRAVRTKRNSFPRPCHYTKPSNSIFSICSCFSHVSDIRALHP